MVEIHIAHLYKQWLALLRHALQRICSLCGENLDQKVELCARHQRKVWIKLCCLPHEYITIIIPLRCNRKVIQLVWDFVDMSRTHVLYWLCRWRIEEQISYIQNAWYEAITMIGNLLFAENMIISSGMLLTCCHSVVIDISNVLFGKKCNCIFAYDCCVTFVNLYIGACALEETKDHLLHIHWLRLWIKCKVKYQLPMRNNTNSQFSN